ASGEKHIFPLRSAWSHYEGLPRPSNFTEGLSRHSLAAAEHKGHEDGINREWTRADTNENILLVDRCGWSLTRRSSPLFAGIADLRSTPCGEPPALRLHAQGRVPGPPSKWEEGLLYRKCIL